MIVQHHRRLERGRRALEEGAQHTDHRVTGIEAGKDVTQPFRSLDRIELVPAFEQTRLTRDTATR